MEPTGRRNHWIKFRIRWTRQKKELRAFWKNPSLSYRSKLIGLSMLSLATALGGAFIADTNALPQKYSLGAVMVGAGIGLFVLAAMTERFVGRQFGEFKGAKVLGLAAVAVATFVAHGAAGVEVNEIFPYDPSNFPHALAAASAMIIVSWLYWAIVPILLASAGSFIYHFFKSEGSNTVISCCVALSFVSIVSLITYQVHPANARGNNIYQIALEMDFNKRHHCVGVPDGSEGVVFIGPEQRLALVAPRRAIVGGPRRSLFIQVAVPTDFKTVNCNVPPAGPSGAIPVGGRR